MRPKFDFRLMRSQSAIGFTEIILGMAIMLVGILAVMNITSTKYAALKANKEAGQLRDLRSYLRRNLNCNATLAQPGCTNPTRSTVEGKSCSNSTLLRADSASRIADYNVRVSCGNDFGPDRLMVEYIRYDINRQLADFPNAPWKDINRGIPWVCESNTGPTTWDSFEVGDGFACGLAGGDVYCMGRSYGGLAEGAAGCLANPSLKRFANDTAGAGWLQDCPIKVAGLVAPVTELKVGDVFVCAKDSTPEWKCWGRVARGIRWDGTNASNPNSVLPLANFDTITMSNVNEVVTSAPLPLADTFDFDKNSIKNGRNPCYIDQNSKVACYQYDTGSAHFPWGSVKVLNPLNSDLSNIIKVSGSRPKGGCALSNSQDLYCWSPNLNIILDPSSTGANATGWNPMPSQKINLGTIGNVIDFHGNLDSGCALLNNNEIKCWGDGSYGGLGNGTYLGVGVNAVTVSSLPSGKTITKMVGRMVLIGDEVYFWGGHPYLLNGGNAAALNQYPTNYDMVNTATKLPELSGVKSLSSRCAIKHNGEVLCWTPYTFYDPPANYDGVLRVLGAWVGSGPKYMYYPPQTPFRLCTNNGLPISGPSIPNGC